MNGRTAVFVLLGVLLVAPPSRSFGSKILLITGGDTSNDAALTSVLQSAGNTVTLGPTYSSFTGTGLSGYNAVVLIPNGDSWEWSNAPMPQSGQQALVNYVNSGGGLVTSNQVLQMELANRPTYDTLSQVNPAVFTGTDGGINAITFTSQSKDPVITAGLPATFTFNGAPPPGGSIGVESFLIPAFKGNPTAFYTTNQWDGPPAVQMAGQPPAALIGGQFGHGWVINMSTPSENTMLSDPNYDRLLTNSVNWVVNGAPGGPSPNPVPEPSSLAVFTFIAIGLIYCTRSRRDRSIGRSAG
jgi:hypothetical protein